MAKVKVDRFGRILIPKELRDMLGLEEGVEVEVEVKGGSITIKPVDYDLERAVDEAVDFLMRNPPASFVSGEGEEAKWYTREHVLRKIGLKE